MKAAKACIDLSALQHNLQRVKAQAPESKVMAVVKANGYGHGLRHVAKHSNHADAFGVARIEEALQLRACGVVKPILLLEGFYSPGDLPVLVTNNIQTVVHCEEQLIALEQADLETPVVVWLKIDSGMHRLGVRPEQYDEFISRLKTCPNVAKPLRYMSHFGCADELDSSITPQQIELFMSLTSGCQGERSLAASAGLLAWPQSQLEWVRPGIIMYGVSPFSDKTAQDLGYQPVMTLKSHLIAVREVKKGESVGYGGIWTSERDTKVGVIAVGYGDGYPRSAPNGTPVWVNGRTVPIAGRVSMDMLTVDLGPDATDKVSDEAILWGKELPVEEVANHIGTIAYELVTKLTPRVEMEYTK
ncbi:alanine racemase [Vibrio parahaemolyticus]|uniref:alanine racemase n=1 Tax=Vibrio parahaemolyticus TaxID=670 RepID=UPI000450019A|nr:alanine racemase [Vibrio parahaemolyticus]EJG0875323.1 alanine racemase [Vibrio parahaemolyticus O3]EJG0903951.1 alanine racemase [Vibrio parahaemolyticus O3:K56]EJG1076483.1 alanine racemase [Vibrio parahaemolyticus O1:K56]EGQ8195497.1 alanine racemase [Vibrio parahaemolyticus]EGQ8276355.1 alanine racemase [Vibrio parahaemolyticus]